MLAWFGGVNIWQRQLEDGSARARAAYEPLRWQRASQAHPWIAQLLSPASTEGS
jgi:hypothetical protein